MERIIRTAQALSGEPRVRILQLLTHGEATVTDLVDRLQIDQPRVSAHLAILLNAALVRAARKGRQRTYSVDKARIEGLLAAFTVEAPLPLAEDPTSASPPDAVQPKTASSGAVRGRRANTPLRQARTCYDHLAGVAGVGLLDEMLRREWLVAADGESAAYRLTPEGEDCLKERALDLQSLARARRAFARACPDWTERRPHLGGALGAAILHSLEQAGAVERDLTSRAVKLRPALFDWLRD